MAHNPMGTDPSDSENSTIFNATTRRENVVDPRTGLFEVCVQMPQITGNNGNGPVFYSGLCYTPTSNNEAGLGDGWDLSFTHYSAKFKTLTFHSGEKLQINENIDVIQPAVHAKWAAGKLTVMRKGGRKEVLVKLANTETYVPESLTTDGENNLFFSWTTTPHLINGVTYYQIKLTGIRDATRQLLSIDYTLAFPGTQPPESAVHITFWPDNPNETLMYTLRLKDYALQSVTLASDIKSSFGYQDHPVCGWLLTEITNSSGLKETVVYVDNGLSFPDNPKLSVLPCVNTYTLTPNGGGLPFIKNYTYVRQNPSSYKTIVSEGSPVIRTITYQYNLRHEVTQEKLVQGSCTTLTEFTTTALPNTLNHSSSTTYIKNGASRKITNQNNYNVDAALQSNKQLGVDTDMDYAYTGVIGLPSAGEIRLASLLNPLGNISATLTALLAALSNVTLVSRTFPSNYLTTSFSTNANGLLPTPIPSEFKYYTYRQVGLLSEAKLTNLLRWSVGSDNLATMALTGKSITYYSTPDFRYGRQWTVKTSSKDTSNYLDIFIEPITHFDYSLGGPDNTEITTLTTEQDTQGNERTLSVTHSILSGRVIRQTDYDGNRTEYAYDQYGRLVTQTLCAQSPAYKQITTYAFPAPGQVQTTEPNGKQYLRHYDGADNLVKEYRVDVGLQLTKSVSYDRIGRETQITDYDYLANGTQISSSITSIYDDWNQPSTKQFSDGRQQFNFYDPIAMKRTEWSGTATDQHGKITYYNTNNTVKKTEWANENGSVHSTQTLTYTRANLVKQLQSTGEFGTTSTDFKYDGAGRLIQESHTEKDNTPNATPLTYSYYYTYPVHWLMNEPAQTDIEFDGARRTLGKRTFDAWGRVTSLTRGTSIETYNYDGAARVPKSTVTADTITLNNQYIPELGNLLSKVSTSNLTQQKTFAYAHGMQNASTASEGQYLLEYTHDAYKQLTKQRIQTQPGSAKEVNYVYSPGGRLLSTTDPTGVVSTFQHNSKGQRDGMLNAKQKVEHVYNIMGNLSTEIITYNENNAGPQATTLINYEYDDQLRESRRIFFELDLSLESTYYNNGNLKTATLKKGTQVMGSRSLTYNSALRVKSCTTTGVLRPKNPNNKNIDRQTFFYDALGNVIRCITDFGTEGCTSIYTYDTTTGSRLEKLEHSHADYTPSATLTYDNCGRMTQDQHGKKYEYDWLGRMTKAGSVRYAYDPSDRLMLREQNSVQSQIIYDGLQVQGEYDPGAGNATRHVEAGSQGCTVLHVKRSGVERLLLELRDANGSVFASCDIVAGTEKYHAYTAFGEHFSDEQDSLLSLNGDYRDTDTGQQPLGCGYRWYDPSRTQLNAKDSLSPFHEGGPNAYGYCIEGDPINDQDRNGHFNVSTALRGIWGDSLPGPVTLGKSGALISTVLWTGIGVLTAVMSGGTSLLITAAIVGLATVSAGLAIASVVVADTNPALSEILAWASLGTGLLGGAWTLAKKVAQLGAYLGRSGLAVAKELYQKTAASLTTTLRRFRLYTGHGNLYGSLAPLPNPRHINAIAYNGNAIITSGGNTQLSSLLGRNFLDAGDLNTVLFAGVTGVLGLKKFWESDEANSINSVVSDGSTFPWGGFGRIWANVRGH